MAKHETTFDNIKKAIKFELFLELLLFKFLAEQEETRSKKKIYFLNVNLS